MDHPKVRFAPSPTGKLHVGNLRTALLNFLVAKKYNGRFILRIDDTDQTRSTKAYEEGIKLDLDWLGLDWDHELNQSKRFDRYDAARDQLIENGFLYPCYETAAELDRKRKLARAQGKPPVYDRAALALTEAQKKEYEAQGRRPHWRFKLSGKLVIYNDLIRGEQRIDTASLSDPILLREDGSYLYSLPSCVDDIDLGIDLIIRGEDHVTNSGTQVELFQALGGTIPQFAHNALLTDKDGSALSKRLGSISIEYLHESGFEPMAINSHLAKMGSSDKLEFVPSLNELAQQFAFDKLGRAPARFDEADLIRLNADHLHESSFDEVKNRLQKLDANLGENFWLAIRPNLERLNEARDWAQIVQGPVAAEIDVQDAEFLTLAVERLPETLNDTSWQAWTGELKNQTGRKGKSLFMPLRRALTGKTHGPQMDLLLPLIEREEVKKRLLINR